MSNRRKIFKIAEEVYSNSEILNLKITSSYIERLRGNGYLEIIEFFARVGLIENKRLCKVCGSEMHLVKKSKIKDKYIWTCTLPCRTEISIRANSIFSAIKSDMCQYLRFLIRWCNNDLIKTISEEVELHNKTISVWCRDLREIIQNILFENLRMLGGIDAAGISKIVEIDESLFFKRKYNRGRLRSPQWVFGGIERNSGECFLVPVPDRKAETLLPIIRQRIQPGSTIISDCWSAYRRISEQGDYIHQTVNHSYNFVDPLSPSVHTQNIENCWLHAKRQIRKQFGTNQQYLEGHIYEFMYKRKFKQDNRINNLLCDLKDFVFDQ